jgi:hypothetical protein
MSRRDLLLDAGPVLNLRQALYRASRDYQGGQNALALSMGVSADELQKRLNPTDCRPLKVEWVEEILSITRDPRLLQAVAGAYSGVVWHEVEPVAATKEAMQALGKYLQREGEFVTSLAEGALDGRWEAHEVEKLEQHGMALVRQLLGMMAGARAAMEDGSDE